MNDVNLSISKELINPIIEAKVNAAVCEALTGHQAIVADVVSRILSQRVDEREGRPSDYSSNPTFVQWLCRNAIREAAVTAVKNYISAANETLVAEVQKSLQKNTKTVAVNLVNSFLKATESEWRMKVDVGFDTKQDK